MTAPIPNTQRVYAPPSAQGSRVAASRSRGPYCHQPLITALRLATSCGVAMASQAFTPARRSSGLCIVARPSNQSIQTPRVAHGNHFNADGSETAASGAESMDNHAPRLFPSGAVAGSSSLRADASQPKAVLLLDVTPAPCAQTKCATFQTREGGCFA